MSISILQLRIGHLFYTMHNKFSNCFVWVSPSTSDLEFHLVSWRYTRRSPDKSIHLKKYQLPNAVTVLKWRLISRLAGNVGTSDIGGSQNRFQTIVCSLKTKKA